jgi:uncharacterized protein YcgL (UPF0745 family)
MSSNKTSMTEMECAVYKSLKKDETYVFIQTTKLLSDLPDELIKVLGQAEMVMTLKLTPEKKMARGSAAEVMESINKQGFHLQMPENPQLNKNPLPTINERFLDKNI